MPSHLSMKNAAFRLIATALLSCALAGTVFAQLQTIDTRRSKITVFVYKSGLFSAFGDDHEVAAPIAEGIIDQQTKTVRLRMAVAQMKVLDPKLAADKREQVQQKMLSPDVLDPTRFPDIAFKSSAAATSAAHRFNVPGELTLHGQTRPVVVEVVEEPGHYTGTVKLKQTDFRITPVKVAGGTVRVKDEVKIAFDVYAQQQ